jgi:hypothetical protein
MRIVRAVPGASVGWQRQRVGHAVPLVVIAQFELLVDRIRDRFVRPAYGVLVDHGGPHVVVSHPSHQILEARARLGGQHVPGMTKIVEMQAGHAHALDHIHPAATGVEAAAPKRATLGAWEDQRARLALDVGIQVLLQQRDDRFG